MRANSLPGSEVYFEDLAGVERTGFVVCAFFTPGDGYEGYAARLTDSCRRFGLPYSVWRVPAIHRSTSFRGSGDIRFTKPNFIRLLLARLTGAAVAYLDVDAVVVASPRAFFDARHGGYDFAIYNWLSDPHNETYLPANRKLVSSEQASSFYQFWHRFELQSTEQLVCSGMTQYYADTPAARQLLDRWQQTIAANPRSADDQSLLFTYNNPDSGNAPVRSLWLDKAYARSPWWPHVAPVILHPTIPTMSQPFQPVTEIGGRRWLHEGCCTRVEEPPLFPRDGGVDINTGIVFRLDDTGCPRPVGRYSGRFWVFDENGRHVELPQ